MAKLSNISKETFSDTQVTGDSKVSSAGWGFCFVCFLFPSFPFLDGRDVITTILHPELSGSLKLEEMQSGKQINTGDSYTLLCCYIKAALAQFGVSNVEQLAALQCWCPLRAACPPISCVPTQTLTPLLLGVTDIHFYFMFNTLIRSFLPLQSLYFFFLITGICVILNWEWVISTSSTFQSTADCQITNSLKEWCSDHSISYPGLLSALVRKKKNPLSFLPAPKFQSNFVFDDVKLVISICWNMICHHLLLNSLAWAGNLEMPPLILGCSPQWLLQERGLFENSGKLKLIQEKYGTRIFQLESSFPSFSFLSVIKVLFHPPQSHTFSGLISQKSTKFSAEDREEF